MMNMLSNLRGRLGSIGCVLASAPLLFLCGLFIIFILVPQQKVEALRIERLPLMDADQVAAAEAGDDLLITGRLENNAVLDTGEFVAYQLDIWDVRMPSSDDSDSKPTGSWSTEMQVFPDLNLDAGGQVVLILGKERVKHGGALHEMIVEGTGASKARYDGNWLREGSQRYQGFYNGDLVTVLGVKAASSGLIPDQFFAGDRVAFEQDQHDQAKNLLYAGIAMLVFGPVVLVGGVLSAIFGKRQR